MVTEAYFKNTVEEFGEAFVVLDSGIEYIIHGSRGYELENGMVEAEGLRENEKIIVRFDLDDVEHIYTHEEI